MNGSARSRLSTLEAALAGLLVYAVLVVWLTWPLASHLATHLPDTHPACHVDTLHMAWALSYQSYRLATSPPDIANANIYHPTPHALFYGEAGFGAVPYFMPLFLLTGNPALALNLTLLGCLTLTACTLHLVVARWTGSLLAGFIAAWTLLTTRWVLWDVTPIAPNYAVLQYFPPIILLAAVSARRKAAAFWLVPLVILQGLTSAYVAAAVMIPLGVLALARLVRPSSRPARLRLLAVLVVATAVLAVPYSGYVLVWAENPEIRRQSPYTALLWNRVALPLGPFALDSPAGLPAAAFALIAAGAVSRLLARYRRTPTEAREAWAHGGLWTVVGLVAAFTPVVNWPTRPERFSHLAIAGWFPFYQVVRASTRLGIGSLMGLSLLAGVSFSECARRIPGGAPMRTLVAAVVATTMFAGYSSGIGIVTPSGAPLPRSYPLQRALAPSSELTRRLAAPGGPVLELPVDAGPRLHAQAMYRSIFHRRQLLNGYDSYWPTGFSERMGLACRLPNHDALEALRRETGIEMILVHLDQVGRRTTAGGPYRCPYEPGRYGLHASRLPWMTLVDGPGDEDLRLVARDGTDVLFSVGDARGPDDVGTTNPDVDRGEPAVAR